MSVEAIRWARATKTGKATAKLVLLILADFADKDGVCWPSQKRIAEESDQSVDTVQRRLRDLEKADLIVRSRRHGRRGGRTSDLYELQMRPKRQSTALCKNSRIGAGQSRNSNEPKPQACGVHIEEPPTEPVLNKKSHGFLEARGLAKRNKPGRSASSSLDQGRMEAIIADRIGSNGWEIILSLPETEVEHLCQRQRRGALDDGAIAKLKRALLS